jgi:hypothetical protein
MDKPRWTEILDADERQALVADGKYREDKPTWVRRATGIWVLVNDVFRKWRESRRQQ